MNGALNWLIGVVVVGVLINLLSSQIDAWLPILARWIVRRQAKKMGQHAARYEEEWLALIEDTPGGLAKLCWVALPTLAIPFRTALNRYLEGPDRLRQLAAWVADRLWWAAAIVLALLLAAYPPNQGRIATYASLVPLLLIFVFALAPGFRRILAVTYDRLNYSQRIAFGGLTLPGAFYFFVALSLLRPTGHSPKDLNIDSSGAETVTMVFLTSQPPDVIEGETSAGADAKPRRPTLDSRASVNPQPRLAPELPPAADVLQNGVGNESPQGAQTRTATPTDELVMMQGPSADGSAEPMHPLPNMRAFRDLPFSELPAVRVPDQPFPNITLAAPTNLRVVP
jgi:hypothetical protein